MYSNEPSRYEGDGLDAYEPIESTSDAAEDVQPAGPPPDAGDTGAPAPPPDADDELGQYEGSYVEPGVTSDLDDIAGTGGGDVGIGGDVSPRGRMHDTGAPVDEIRADDSLVSGARQTRASFAEREEDLDLAADDLADQGVDEAWPRSQEPDEADARASFDDPDDPATDVIDEDELGAA